jgi:hypothetical protein
MRYLHYITRTEDDKQIESYYSNNATPSWTKELWCKSSKGKFVYKIWDRETQEVKFIA